VAALADDATPILERFADRLLAIVERLDALVGPNDRGLNGAHALGRFNQLGVELAAVTGNRFDIALELRLVLERPPLLTAQSVKLLIALLERVESNRLSRRRTRILDVGLFGGRHARRPQLQPRRWGCHRRARRWRGRRWGGCIVQIGDFAGLQRRLCQRCHHSQGGASEGHESGRPRDHRTSHVQDIPHH
jgi:hypothetical protein